MESEWVLYAASLGAVFFLGFLCGLTWEKREWVRAFARWDRTND